MSFSFTIQTKPGDNIDAVVEAAVDEQIEQAHANNYEPNVELARALGMIEAVKRHIHAVRSAIARPEDRLSITVSGHANPSAEPNPGWASNMLSVSVNQVYGETA